jgi:F0F1-type ATP synthase membrane subunit c/vacuolar-type H+-ATPase subunit K
MDAETFRWIAIGLKYVGVGIAMIPIGAVGLGIAKIFATLISEVSRNPGAKNTLFTYALIGFALTEAAALYVLVVAFMVLFS